MMVYIISINPYGNLQYYTRHGWRNIKHMGRIKPMLFKPNKIPAWFNSKECEAVPSHYDIRKRVVALKQ